MEKTKKINVAYNIAIGTLVLVAIVMVVRISGGGRMEEAEKKSGVSVESFENMEGKKMPEFSFKDIEGNVVSSESLMGKKYALFFNEGLMCYPACWNQMLEFAKDERFKSDDMKVLSVVVDPREGWKKAIEKKPEMGTINIMFDSSSALSRKLKLVNAKSSMHPGTYPGHTYMIVDKEGIVRFVLDDPNMALNNNVIYSKLSELE